MDKPADVCFEVSWEVCNKVGGIYTVVSSKAKAMIANYGKDYFLIGPYFMDKARGDFDEYPVDEELKPIFQELESQGIICHFGKWLVEESPKAILIDYASFTKNTNEIKTALWKDFGIDSLATDFHDFDEPVVWATAVAKFIEAYRNKTQRKIVAHFHEWLAGAGILYLKKRNVKVGTVFTTHATMLGRTIAADNRPLYEDLKKIDAVKEAYRYGIQSKFLTEKACAVTADAFTTVSEITGIEAEYLLGKKPDFILPNGLAMSSFPTIEESSLKHRLFKKRMKEFIMSYFFPYYDFDINDTLIFFTAARYEYRTKGLDIMVRSLGELNNILKKYNSKANVVTFFFIPANTRSVDPELVENRKFFLDVKESVDDNADDLKSQILKLLVTKKTISDDNLFREEDRRAIHLKLKKFWKNKGAPSMSSHTLFDSNDPLLRSFRENGLTNSQSDPVKVIFYPVYLTGADSLLDTGYYETIMGSHLGIFPSYYEPWGYTPLEAAALDVSSITTDLSGFGRYLQQNMPAKPNQGVFILNRFGKDDNSVVNQLTQQMYQYTQLTHEERVAQKLAARDIANMADWKSFVKYYLDAHSLAMHKVAGPGDHQWN